MNTSKTCLTLVLVSLAHFMLWGKPVELKDYNPGHSPKAKIEFSVTGNILNMKFLPDTPPGSTAWFIIYQPLPDKEKLILQVDLKAVDITDPRAEITLAFQAAGEKRRYLGPGEKPLKCKVSAAELDEWKTVSLEFIMPSPDDSVWQQARDLNCSISAASRNGTFLFRNFKVVRSAIH